MIGAFDVAAIRAAEQAHCPELESGVLMARASTALALTVSRILVGIRGRVYGARVVIAVGSGNNGADALLAGARLAGRGASVVAVALWPRVHHGAALALRRAGGRMVEWDPKGPDHFLTADLVIDGILGIGATGALRDPADTVIRRVNASGALVVSVDLPSGVDADTGQVLGEGIEAEVTVTFGGQKPGLLIAPGCRFAGLIEVVDIGIGDSFPLPTLLVMAPDDVARLVPEPGFADHKYRRGVVGIAAGSGAYPGAARLAAVGARMGDGGMVWFLDRGDGVSTEVVRTFPDIVSSSARPADVVRVDAWACGPGFTTGDAHSIAEIICTSHPLILDAGALTSLATDMRLQESLAARRAGTVITPHEGEAARLADAYAVDASKGRLSLAQALANAMGVVVVLKGPGTIIASPTGLVIVDTVGGAELATAGSGDVLTGLMGAMIAGASARGELQPHGENAHDSLARVAAGAVWLHGQAGRLAAQDGRPVTAVDIADNLGAAVANLRR